MTKILFLLSFFLFLDNSEASLCIEVLDREQSPIRVTCPNKMVEVAGRKVLWQQPKGEAPAEGFPAVILSQGSWFPVKFSRQRFLPFGGFHEVRLIQSLLDAGYTVIAPRAIAGVAWTTNVTLLEYKKSADYKFFKKFFEALESGDFGLINKNQIFATGVSSGGYNSSRLSLIFPEYIRAIAIQSASYSDCLGPLCDVPSDLPSEHVPTLFLHGEKDLAVPFSTAMEYFERLQEIGIETKMVVDSDAGHGWLEQSPEAVLEWFRRYTY